MTRDNPVFEIIACPHCGAYAKTLKPCEKSLADLRWEDSHRLFIDVNYIASATICHACAKSYQREYALGAGRLGDPHWDLSPDERTLREWQAAPPFVELSEQGYYRALNDGIARHDADLEFIMRMEAWWKGKAWRRSKVPPGWWPCVASSLYEGDDSVRLLIRFIFGSGFSNENSEEECKSPHDAFHRISKLIIQWGLDPASKRWAATQYVKELSKQIWFQDVTPVLDPTSEQDDCLSQMIDRQKQIVGRMPADQQRFFSLLVAWWEESDRWLKLNKPVYEHSTAYKDNLGALIHIFKADSKKLYRWILLAEALQELGRPKEALEYIQGIFAQAEPWDNLRDAPEIRYGRCVYRVKEIARAVESQAKTANCRPTLALQDFICESRCAYPFRDFNSWCLYDEEKRMQHLLRISRLWGIWEYLKVRAQRQKGTTAN